MRKGRYGGPWCSITSKAGRRLPSVGSGSRGLQVSCPVTYDSKFEDYYLPAVLEATEYPRPDQSRGERISTIAAPTVLVSYNWPARLSNRYQARRTLHRLPL